MQASVAAVFLTGDRSRLDARWQTPQTCDPYARLYWVREGGGFVRHHGREFPLVPGHAYLIPPRCDFAHGCPERVEIWWAHVTLELWGSLDAFACLPCRYELDRAEAGQAFSRQLRQLLALAGQESATARLAMTGLILLLAAPFFRVPPTAAAAGGGLAVPQRRFLPVLDYIDHHLRENTPLSRLAALVHLQPAYFCHRFAQCFGLGPAAWRNRRRIDRGIPLLLGTERTLDDIAGELGFANAFHFSRMFKRVTGLAPDRFRHRRPGP
ncbi:MAG: AraC family transcriptional regulator [Lentisphaeria bacterium]